MNLGNDKSIFKTEDTTALFDSVSDIPTGFVGTARVGTDLYVGDRTSLVAVVKGNDSLKLPATTLAKNQQALGIGQLNVGIIGDSLSVGQFAIPSAGANWFSGESSRYGLDALLAGKIANGSNDNFFGGIQANDTSIDNLITADSRISQSAGNTWTCYQLTFKTISGGFDYVAGGTGATLTLAPNKTWDRVDIYYISNVGYGTLAITGATTGSINANATLGISSVTLTKTNDTGSLSFTPTGEIHLCGVVFYSTVTPRINFLRLGLGSSQSAHWVDNTAVWKSLPSIKALMFGVTGSNNPVHLFIVQLGANDHINGVAVGTYTTNMQTLITALKANVGATALSDIVLMTTPPLKVGGNVTAATNAAYRQAVYDLGNTNNLRVIDNYADFGSFTYGNTQGWYSSANLIHESAAGYIKVAKNIMLSGAFI